MLYILNSLIIPLNLKYKQATVILRRITIEEAKQLINSQSFTSAIGHEATASLLSKLLGIVIPFNRISISFEAGDEGLHFVLKTRLPEGKILTEEELSRLEFELIHSKVISAQ